MRPSPKQNQSAKPNTGSYSILRSLRLRLSHGATAGLIATAILGTTGCKSMPFTLPTPSMPKLAMPTLGKPDVSKLAFWRSENLMAKKGNLPKPPSLSFDPSPIKQALASSKNAASQEVQSLRGQISETRNKLTEPIREPYKFAAKSAVDKLASNSKLDLKGDSSRNLFAKPDQVGSKITKAQRDFQAALASSSKAIEKSAGGKIADLKTKGNDFALPGSIKAAKTNVDDSLLAVNRSLYNAKGKLASSAKDSADDASAGLGNATNDQLSMFEQRLKKAAEKAKGAPTELASAASESASNAFADAKPGKTLSPPSLPTGNMFASKSSAVAATPASSTDATSEVSSEVAELKAQLATMKLEQQKFMEQQLAATQARTAVQSPAAMPSFQTATAPQATPAARMSAPNEYVANLTARPTQSLPPASASASNGNPSSAYPQMYPSSAPLRTASSTNNVLSSAPQNVLRRNFSPVASQSPESGSQPVYGSQEQSVQPGAYPSTPYGGYGSSSNYSASAAPTHAAPTRTAQASFQQNGDSNLVINASTPVEPAERHVSEINIPDAVLQGTSNYAPGTVHPLR